MCVKEKWNEFHSKGSQLTKMFQRLIFSVFWMVIQTCMRGERTHDSPTFTFVAAHFRRCHATIDKMLQTNFNDFNFSISFIFRVRLISSISIKNLCSMIELSLGFLEFFTHSKWHCSEKFYFQHLNHLWWWSFWFYVRMKIKFDDS